MVVGGDSSPDSPVLSGVPLGSVLGSLLFFIHIDDVSSLKLSDNTVLNLHADDMLLYKKIKCSEDYQQLQLDIDKISSWVGSNHLSLNPAKCKTMLLSRKRNLSYRPYARTNAFQSSFAPSTISTWNHLPYDALIAPSIRKLQYIQFVLLS